MKKRIILDMGISGTQHIFKDQRGKRKPQTSVTEIDLPQENITAKEQKEDETICAKQ